MAARKKLRPKKKTEDAKARKARARALADADGLLDKTIEAHEAVVKRVSKLRKKVKRGELSAKTYLAALREVLSLGQKLAGRANKLRAHIAALVDDAE